MSILDLLGFQFLVLFLLFLLFLVLLVLLLSMPLLVLLFLIVFLQNILLLLLEYFLLPVPLRLGHQALGLGLRLRLLGPGGLLGLGYLLHCLQGHALTAFPSSPVIGTYLTQIFPTIYESYSIFTRISSLI